VTRHNEEIRSVNVRHQLNPGIQYSLDFAKWEAAVAAGSTLEELKKMDDNLYPKWFVARLVAWHELHNLIEMHMQDAQNTAMERMSKKR